VEQWSSGAVEQWKNLVIEQLNNGVMKRECFGIAVVRLGLPYPGNASRKDGKAQRFHILSQVACTQKRYHINS
jgi:hypothetical protein